MNQNFIKLNKCDEESQYQLPTVIQEPLGQPDMKRNNSVTKIIQSYEDLLKSVNTKLSELTIDLQLTRSKLVITETRYTTLLGYVDGFGDKKQSQFSQKKSSFQKLLDRIDELQKKLIIQNAQILRYKAKLIKQKKINQKHRDKQIGSQGQGIVQRHNLPSYFNFESIRDDFMISSRTRKNSAQEQQYSLPWQRAIQNFNDQISSPTKFKQKTIGIVKKFIPHQQRSKVWPLIFQNMLGLSDSLYIQLMERRSKNTIQQHIISQIQRDITRSFSNKTIQPYKQSLSIQLQEMLEIFHLLRPDISYVQGMTYPAIILTIVVGKIEAFKIFSNLILCNKFFRNMYTFQQNWIQISCKAFEHLLRDWNSDVHKHLQDLQVKVEIFLVQWFFTIFSRGMSLQTTLKIWDLIGYQRQVVLYRICLSIFEMIGKRLLGQNYENTVGLIQSYWSYVDEDRLLDLIVNSKLTNERLTRTFTKCKKQIKQRQKQKKEKLKEKRLSYRQSLNEDKK